MLYVKLKYFILNPLLSLHYLGVMSPLCTLVGCERYWRWVVLCISVSWCQLECAVCSGMSRGQGQCQPPNIDITDFYYVHTKLGFVYNGSSIQTAS